MILVGEGLDGEAAELQRKLLEQGFTLRFEHCVNGKRKDPAQCPYALLFHDEGFPSALVFSDRIEAKNLHGSSVIVCAHDAPLSDLLQMYDDGLIDFVPGFKIGAVRHYPRPWVGPPNTRKVA